MYIHNRIDNAGSPKRLLYELPFFLVWYYYALCALVVNVTTYNHLKGISRRNRHDIRHWYVFTAFSPLKSNAFYFNLRNYFAIAYLSLSENINIQLVGVNWFTETVKRDWLMSSIGTFWLANALGEHRAIAERHSTEVECLKKIQKE